MKFSNLRIGELDNLRIRKLDNLRIRRLTLTSNLQKLTSNQGFTLIELLVVIVIFAILGVVGTDLFSSVIRGTNKANVISEVKQNGQLAMDMIERNIREARDASNPIIPTPSPHPNTTVLDLIMTVGTVRFQFIPEGSTTNGQIYMNGEPITSTDPVTGVNVESASFVINEPPASSPSSPKTVTVTLNLEQGVSASTRKDFTADVTLSTDVSLRSY
ncbi:hypothetical protein A2Z23_03165 [Candidatus Curtissbacteria bacterium RBG_16_39_7]|uniref:Uncharacterized protein n=1 Tax=Candidatus Curtissbacteria bacterium RBG_16_39_7 TaxID=1797707 RepID=A0A1F5G2W4_9BACT|nr:MAG: hypothetical protein A2Z23_03165 [Candidatus Curtissbacteria bacterium RBG_16_39_7]